MAGRHECSNNWSITLVVEGRRPSIYAAFNLARLVHSFISRVRSHINARQSSTKRSLDVPFPKSSFPPNPVLER